MMSNQKNAHKMILGLLAAAFLCVVSGAAVIFGIFRLGHTNTMFYEEPLAPLQDITKAIEYSQALQVQLIDAVLYSGDAERLDAIKAEIQELAGLFEAHISVYAAAVTNAESRKLLDEAKQLYYNDYRRCLDEALAGIGVGADQAFLTARLNEAETVADKITDRLTASMDIKIAGAESASESNRAMHTKIQIAVIAIVAAVVIAALRFVFYPTGKFGKLRSMSHIPYSFVNNIKNERQRVEQ